MKPKPGGNQIAAMRQVARGAAKLMAADDGPRIAAFIHIPPLPRAGTALPQGSPRITLEALVDAGEAMLMELVKLARQASSRAS